MAEARLPAAAPSAASDGSADQWRLIRCLAHELALLSRLLLPAAAAAPLRIRVDAPLLVGAEPLDRFCARRAPPCRVAEWATAQREVLCGAYVSTMLGSAECVCVSIHVRRSE